MIISWFSPVYFSTLLGCVIRLSDAIWDVKASKMRLPSTRNAYFEKTTISGFGSELGLFSKSFGGFPPMTSFGFPLKKSTSFFGRFAEAFWRDLGGFGPLK